MRCCKCGKELPDYAKFCKYCGAEQAAIAEPAKPEKKKRKWPMVFILGFFLIGGGVGGYSHFRGRSVSELIRDISGITLRKEIPSEILVSTAFYNSEGKLTASKAYTYSRGGLRAECLHTGFDPLTSEQTYKRTTQYELTKPYILSELKSSKSFDESGNMMEEEIHEDNGKKSINRIYTEGITTETIHYYDENGYLIKLEKRQNGVLLNEDMNIVLDIKSAFFKRYDGSGNLSETCSVVKKPDGKLTVTNICNEFDTNGNRIKSRTYVDKILRGIGINTYRTAEQLTEETEIPETIEVKGKVRSYSLFQDDINNFVKAN